MGQSASKLYEYRHEPYAVAAVEEEEEHVHRNHHPHAHAHVHHNQYQQHQHQQHHQHAAHHYNHYEQQQDLWNSRHDDVITSFTESGASPSSTSYSGRPHPRPHPRPRPRPRPRVGASPSPSPPASASASTLPDVHQQDPMYCAPVSVCGQGIRMRMHSVFRELSRKQYLIESRYARIPSHLHVSAPRKVQRVSRMRLHITSTSTSTSSCDGVRSAARDFIHTLEGPGVAEGDVGIETLTLLLQTDIEGMLRSCDGGKYVQETFSLPCYLHNALAKVDVVVGCLGEGEGEGEGDGRRMVGVFYTADVAFIDLVSLTFTDVFYLTDRALFCRNGDATRWVVIAKLLCRLGALQRAAHEQEEREEDDRVEEFVQVRQMIADEYGLL